MPVSLAKPDCTCDGFHTDSVHESVSDYALRYLTKTESCPVERRALQRALAGRLHHV